MAGHMLNFSSHIINVHFLRAADETKSWMNEKDTALLSDDYGRDLASVQTLQRKHEGLERDLAALEETVKVLRMDAAQLVGAQPAASWRRQS